MILALIMEALKSCVWCCDGEFCVQFNASIYEFTEEELLTSATCTHVWIRLADHFKIGDRQDCRIRLLELQFLTNSGPYEQIPQDNALVSHNCVKREN